MKKLLAHSSVCSMRDLLRLVFLAFVNDDSDSTNSFPPPSPPVRAPAAEGEPDSTLDISQEDIQNEFERKGFHYLNDVQGCGATRRMKLQLAFRDLFLQMASFLTSPPPSPRPPPLTLEEISIIPVTITPPDTPPSSMSPSVSPPSTPPPKRTAQERPLTPPTMSQRPPSPTPVPVAQPMERSPPPTRHTSPPLTTLNIPRPHTQGTNGHVLNLAIIEGFSKIFYSDKDHEMLDKANILYSLRYSLGLGLLS